MIKYTQHIPNYCSGFEPKLYETETLEELLDYLFKEGALKDPKRELVFANGDYETLMIASTTDAWYWVIGFVSGVDLRDYLPHYNSCYKFKPGENKVFKFKTGLGEHYMFDHKEKYEYLARDGDNPYALLRLDNSGGIGWINERELIFLRYSTQQDVDKINARNKKDSRVNLEDCYFYKKYKNK